MSQPNVLQRTQFALRMGARAFRLGLSVAGEQKASPYSFPVHRTNKPAWAMTNYDAFYSEGYDQNALIFAVINVKTRAMAQASMRVYRGERDNPEPVETGALAEAMRRPNPYMSHQFLHELQLVFRSLTGNSYTYIDTTGGTIQLWPIDPRRMTIVIDRNELLGYVYLPEGKSFDDGIPFFPDQILHIKYPNPSDPYNGLGYGKSPLTSCARSADIDNMLTSYLNILFSNGAMLQGILSTESKLTDDQVDRIKKRWHEQYGGFEKWYQVGVLDSGTEYQRLGMTADEMGFDSLDMRNESRILEVFGVPAELVPTRLGQMGSTFANKDEARRIFWEDNMLGELNLVGGEYSYRFDTNGEWLGWDTSAVPALRKDVAALVTAAGELIDRGIPPTVAFKAVGLKVDDYDGNDVSIIPANMVLLSDLIDPPEPEPEPPPQIVQMPAPEPMPDDDENQTGDDEADDETRAHRPRTKTAGTAGFATEEKERLWKAFDETAASWEDRFKAAARIALGKDKREIMALVSEAKSAARQRKGSIKWLDLDPLVDQYFEDKGNEQWREEFRPLISGIIDDTGTFWAGELGVEFDIHNIEGELWFQNYTLKFAQDDINVTTRSRVHEIIAQAQDEGWTIDQMSNHMGATFDQWLTGDLSPEDFAWLESRMPVYRLELIARTETTRLANGGAMNLYNDWGVTEKEWLTSIDGRERDTHRDLNGKIVGIKDDFISSSGAKLQHPGDPGAPVEEIANCRCTILPRV